MAADWSKIEAEYITTDTSYRRLADKYNVDQATIARKAKKEDWVSKRQRHISTTQAKVLAADTKQRVDRATKLYNAADQLLSKIVKGLETSPIVTANAAKNYSDALKNIKEIHMIRSAEDVEEQKARIDKLRKESMSDNKKEPIQVILDDGLMEYGK